MLYLKEIIKMEKKNMQLPIDTETICYLIQKIREFHAKEEVVLPDSLLSPAEDWSLQALADHQDDPTYAEVVETIKDLEPDQQIALVALMWIGRGDFSSSEWDDAVETATEVRGKIPTGEYLLSTPYSADFIEEALNQFGFGCGE